MISNINIMEICEGGHHADISFDVISVNKTVKGLEYNSFFFGDSSGDLAMDYLKYLLNQYEHSDWQSLKTALEA